MTIGVVYKDAETDKLVATITKSDDGLYFEYDSSWRGNLIDPSLPLDFKGLLSEWQIEGLIDRVPVKTNPRYKEYCAKWEISPDETDLLTILCTVGHRTASSSVCSPIGWAPGLWKKFGQQQ